MKEERAAGTCTHREAVVVDHHGVVVLRGYGPQVLVRIALRERAPA
jgi:hypothetical protein